MVDLDELLPRARSPRDYLDLVGDPRADQAVLRALAASPYSFVRKAVAAHRLADATTLAAISTGDLGEWDQQHLLAALARHPNAERILLLRVLAETVALLQQPGRRPYAVALALAQRSELWPEEIGILGLQPGASRRMRRGLRCVLAGRAMFGSRSTEWSVLREPHPLP